MTLKVWIFHDLHFQRVELEIRRIMKILRLWAASYVKDDRVNESLLHVIIAREIILVNRCLTARQVVAGLKRHTIRRQEIRHLLFRNRFTPLVWHQRVLRFLQVEISPQRLQFPNQRRDSRLIVTVPPGHFKT